MKMLKSVHEVSTYLSFEIAIKPAYCEARVYNGSKDNKPVSRISQRMRRMFVLHKTNGDANKRGLGVAEDY